MVVTVAGTPPGGIEPVVTVVEPEGTTLVFPQPVADDHDHLFVAHDRAEAALRVLHSVAAAAGGAVSPDAESGPLG